MSGATVIDAGNAQAKVGLGLRFEIGTKIDFGDPGEGRITARDDRRVFVESPVFTGWIDEAWLAGQLKPNEDE